jgi:SAM-dependent methyltransferase
MISLDSIMSSPLVYRTWMAPFAEKKFAPIVLHNDLRRVRRVLDVGCGPGTNARHFAGTEYLGIDVNERYVQSARRRHGDHFVAADAAEFLAGPNQRFDFILVNSFLHHLDTSAARRILLNLAQLLTEDGHIHIMELVLPQSASVARFMAHADRGKFAREIDEWARMFQEVFQQIDLEQYKLGALGVALWEMVYFKGRVLGTAPQPVA